MGVYTVLVGKPEGKRAVGRPSRRWRDNIYMDITVVGWEAWIGFIWLRIGTEADTCKRGNESFRS